MPRSILLCLLLVATLWACKKKEQAPQKPAPDYDASIAGSFTTQTALKFDSTLLDSFFIKYPEAAQYQADVRKFYRGRNFAFAWFDKDGFTEQAENLGNRMVNLLKLNGEPDTTIHQAALISLLDTTFTAQVAPVVDMMLTSQYFHYSKRNFSSSISEEAARKEQWFLPRNKFDASKVLDEALASGKSVFENEPIHRQYTLLKQQLLSFHQKGLDTIQSKIVLGKRPLKMGDSAAVVLTLRQRLHQLGDLPASNNSYFFDEELSTGISHFQTRHGLEVTGTPSASFLQELNIPGKDRRNQLLVNLERFRWIPAAISGEHLFVNIPEYRLHAYQGDTLNWSMDVIVGQDALNTVIFNGNISYIAFSPYWNIPPGIYQRKVLPAMRRNPNYLARNNMQVVGYAGKMPLIRQNPGGSNPMGKAKFMFPNSFSIYLHDTPDKDLFAKAERSFSSGCVRVSDAFGLAKYLLKDMPDWTDESIDQAMNATAERRVNLRTKMPVYIGYFTSWVDREGKLNFRKDIYGRDKKLAAQLLL